MVASNPPRGPSSRPAKFRSPLRSKGSEPQEHAKPRFTSRALILLAVLGILMASFASSLRSYADQRTQLADLRAAISDSHTEITALTREKERWNDPAYVVAQARARFTFAFPGETAYQVLDSDGRPLDYTETLSDPIDTTAPATQWWQTTLRSVRVAGSRTATGKISGVDGAEGPIDGRYVVTVPGR